MGLAVILMAIQIYICIGHLTDPLEWSGWEAAIHQRSSKQAEEGVGVGHRLHIRMRDRWNIAKVLKGSSVSYQYIFHMITLNTNVMNPHR